MKPEDEPSALYSIGAVSGLTGVTSSTLRTWERRYGAVTPARTPGGGRRYTEADVERVQLLATLIRAVESLGVIAGVPTDALRARADALPSSSHATGATTCRVAVVHRRLGAMLEAAGRVETELVSTHRSIGDVRGPVDVVFVDLALLGAEPESAVADLYDGTGARLVVVDYSFARLATLRALADAGALLVRGPLTVAEADRILDRQRERSRATIDVPALPSEAPPTRFTMDVLARLRERQPHNPCECPNHLATLVVQLREFEAYAQRCVSTNPKDRDLHAALAMGTGRARAVMEELLSQLCAHEGLDALES